ncbi:MAG: DUF4349 domain-containing protein [Aridibacter sp.]
MRNIKFITVFMFVSLFLFSCSGESTTESQMIASNTNASMDEDAPALQTGKIAQKDDLGGGGGGGGKEETISVANPQPSISLDDAEKSKTEEPEKIIGRKIIRNADLKLETKSPEEAQRKITAIAETKNGFVITSSQKSTNSQVSGRDSVSMTIRIPADKFQESLTEIRKTVDRVVVETISGQDVTEEFVDIEARLKTKKALEERFLEIMKQAKSVEDALNVERQLAEVRTEIERIEGRKRFLENQTSLSTITLELQTPAAISGSSNGFFYELREALSDGFSAALTFILVLVRVLIALIPFLLIFILPIYLLWRYFRKRNKKAETAESIFREEVDVE